MNRFAVPVADATSRYRLRLGNEELAISAGITLIGRDPSCRITIFDALISRRHARILCDGEHATIEDMGSRNGTRINSVTISGPHKLKAGDRVGIGACELVVSLVGDLDDAQGTPTGLLTMCSDCRLPYSASLSTCPNCGSTRATQDYPARRNEDTTRGRWSLGMVVEMLGRAMLTENVVEVDRLMRQAALLISDQRARGEAPEEEALQVLGEVCAWLAKVQNASAWSAWFTEARATHR